MSARIRDSLGVRVALMVVPVTLLLGAVELAFRLLPEPRRDAVLERFVIPDPDLLWRLRPAASGPLATNGLGLRDTPYRANADAKVLVLGDSVAWGDGIDEVTRTYPYLLERRLSARHPGTTFEVVNAGVPGYTSEQEATWLELYGLALEPDLIVATFCLNDVITRPPYLTRWGGREALRQAYGFLLDHSHAFTTMARVMQRRAQAQETGLVRALVEPGWDAQLERAWRRMLAQLDRVRVLGAARGVPVLLLAAPYRSQTEDPDGRRHPQERLAAWAAAHGVAFVDVLRVLATLSRDAAARGFHDESHFSHLGHDLVADMLLVPVEHALRLASAAVPRPEDKVRAYALAHAAQAAGAEGAFPKAVAMLTDAERLAPDVGLLCQYQSNVSYLMGDRAGAVRALQRGLTLEPDNALFRRNLATIAAEASASPSR